MNILVVDDEKNYRETLKIILEDEGYNVHEAKDGEEALFKVKNNEYHIVFSDLKMPKMDGMELLRGIKSVNESTKVIIITGYGTIENAVCAMKRGAETYFIKGCSPKKIIEEIKSIEKNLRNENIDNNHILKSKNKTFNDVLRICKKTADRNVNILLLGESGVGKDVLVNYIHNNSNRKEGKLRAVNCNSFSENLIESELFGYHKGAFTGALKDRIGKFEAAHGSTLFLDEIGDLGLNTQVKILRTLENKEIERIGSNETIKVDFRLICATNRNIYRLIEENKFRKDLFYRISTIVVDIPSLRDRREDIEDFIEFFIGKSEKNMDKTIHKVEDSLMEFLLNYNYPGNIRELKNIIERLVVLSEDGIMRKRDISIRERSIEEYKSLKEYRKNLEQEYITGVLKAHDYNVAYAAEKLNISKRQLFNKIKEYNIVRK
ncbi:sigma-54-dependent Fis family transcriptional regulator [Anaeromicrobium sediminis]|uniref:Stage 0 sporulation protein A homolog n=2 Tax=Anaeromicrobium sediminis TaxID=1478221 RepID=A0A267MJ24_9FIRM|nr:sigma-54-dependent Fis family transcriptional regulator [Anaeromicrobium sediminis]